MSTSFYTLNGTQSSSGTSNQSTAVIDSTSFFAIKGDQGVSNEDLILKLMEAISAYDVWRAIGNTGTPEEFLASLQGIQGVQGIQGEVGPVGPSMNISGLTWSNFE
jgi:hypothetical protein